MSQTKIVVIPLKRLLIGAVIAAIVIAFVIFAVVRLGSKGSDNSKNTTQHKSSTVNASASSNKVGYCLFQSIDCILSNLEIYSNCSILTPISFAKACALSAALSSVLLYAIFFKFDIELINAVPVIKIEILITNKIFIPNITFPILCLFVL